MKNRIIAEILTETFSRVDYSYLNSSAILTLTEVLKRLKIGRDYEIVILTILKSVTEIEQLALLGKGKMPVSGGICSNLPEHIKNIVITDMLLYYCFVTWPKWNKKSLAFPVGNGAKDFTETPHWEGEQLKLRLDLLSHIGNQLSSLLELADTKAS